ncbi:signal peptidase I [Streptomyces sp. NPDC088197]|uniref:signal peptidase I n=1 Tax=unclassified Streptomyces TaxID=2593676 RepID=UPI0033AA0725
MSSSSAIRKGEGRFGRTVSGLAIALGCALFLGGFAWGAVEYRPYTVPTNSMQPTVQPGDRVLAQKVSGSDVRRGDVVVFQDKLWGDLPEVKRVVGVGGDVVKCCDTQSRLTVNGTAVDEEGYLDGSDASAAPGGSGLPGVPASVTKFSTTVPRGSLFLLGDNRAVSQDSRIRLSDAQHGAVPVSAVKGRVDGTVWPMGRMGTLSPTTAFKAVPGGGTSAEGPLRWIVVMVVVGAVLILGGAAYGPVAGLLRRRR